MSENKCGTNVSFSTNVSFWPLSEKYPKIKSVPQPFLPNDFSFWQFARDSEFTFPSANNNFDLDVLLGLFVKGVLNSTKPSRWPLRFQRMPSK